LHVFVCSRLPLVCTHFRFDAGHTSLHADITRNANCLRFRLRLCVRRTRASFFALPLAFTACAHGSVCLVRTRPRSGYMVPHTLTTLTVRFAPLSHSRFALVCVLTHVLHTRVWFIAFVTLVWFWFVAPPTHLRITHRVWVRLTLSPLHLIRSGLPHYSSSVCRCYTLLCTVYFPFTSRSPVGRITFTLTLLHLSAFCHIMQASLPFGWVYTSPWLFAVRLRSSHRTRLRHIFVGLYRAPAFHTFWVAHLVLVAFTSVWFYLNTYCCSYHLRFGSRLHTRLPFDTILPGLPLRASRCLSRWVTRILRAFALAHFHAYFTSRFTHTGCSRFTFAARLTSAAVPHLPVQASLRGSHNTVGYTRFDSFTLHYLFTRSCLYTLLVYIYIRCRVRLLRSFMVAVHTPRLHLSARLCYHARALRLFSLCVRSFSLLRSVYAVYCFRSFTFTRSDSFAVLCISRFRARLVTSLCCHAHFRVFSFGSCTRTRLVWTLSCLGLVRSFGSIGYDS